MTEFLKVVAAAAFPLVIVGGGTFALIKWAKAEVWHALLLLIGGYWLAKSPVAPYIGTFLARIPGLFGVHISLPAIHVGSMALPARLHAAAGEVRRP